MRFFALFFWVLALSWLTHAAASPSWRTSNTVDVFLSSEQASNLSLWKVDRASTSIVEGADESILVNPDTDRWGRAMRDVAVSPTEKFYHLKATLRTDSNPTQRLTLFPKPVFHLFVKHGEQQYPFVERPMFFKNEVLIDEIIELTGTHDEVELSLVKAPNANWRLSNLSLSAVQVHKRYNGSFSVLIGLWGLTLLWGVTKAWRRSGLPTLVVGALLTVFLVGVLASRSQVVYLFDLLSNAIRSIGGQITAGHFAVFMQMGHIGLFCVLTVAALVSRHHWRLSYIQIILGMIVLAVATEALQRHVFGRTPDAQDFIFDVFGIAIGSLLLFVSKFLFSKFSRAIS